MKIQNFRSENLFYSQPYSWLKEREKNNSKKFNEAFEPLENSWGGDHTLAKNIFTSSQINLETIFDKEWVNKSLNEEQEKYYKKTLLDNGLSYDQIDSLFVSSKNNALRAAAWSKSNISLGTFSTIFSLLSLFFGIAKEGLALGTTGEQCYGTTGHEDNWTAGHEDNWTTGLLGQLRNGDSEPYSFLSSIASFFHSIFRSQRNHFQYKIYSLPDDDAAMNVYQADVYGNKIAGRLAEASTYMETKINPFLIPVTELLPKNIGECIKKLISLPTSLWWRARLPAYINQEFFTDFLNYLLHKPLSIFGNNNSKSKILEIDQRGNLKWDYFKKRHRENLGLQNNKQTGLQDDGRTGLQKDSNEIATSDFSNPPRSPRSTGGAGNDKSTGFCNSICALFNKDPTISASSGKRLGEFIAPALGIYGFFASALGNTTSALFKLFKVENIYSKISNLIQYSSIYSQQLVYFPKIIIPFLAETRQIEKIVNEFSGNNEKKDEETCEETCDRKSQEELNLLAKERKITSYAGVLSFIVHSISMASRLIGIAGDRSRYVPKYISRITEELSSALINFFFSSRRYLMGEQFRIENPEFYG